MFVPAQLLHSTDDVIGLLEKKTINFTQPPVIFFYSLIDLIIIFESRWCLQTSRDRVVMRHVPSACQRFEDNPITARSPTHSLRLVAGCVGRALREMRVYISFPAKNHLPIPTVPPHPSKAGRLSDMGVSTR